MAGTNYFMMAIFTGQVADKARKAFDEAGKIATEATINIRTVAALTREDKFFIRYMARVSQLYMVFLQYEIHHSTYGHSKYRINENSTRISF